MRRSEAVWLAGFLDGEGCFHVAESKLRGRWAPQLHVACCHRPTMEFIAGLLKAPLRATTFRDPKCRTRWSVTLCGAMAILAVLDQVEPHLRTKREEAAIFRAFCLTFPKRATNRALSYAMLVTRDNLAKRLKAIKREEWTDGS